MKRQAIQWKYSDLIHGVDFEIINEGETGKNPEIFKWNTELYPKPTDEQMLIWFDEFKCIEDRRMAYIETGLTFDYWNEINIEGDQAKIDKYIADRDAIRTAIPKPS